MEEELLGSPSLQWTPTPTESVHPGWDYLSPQPAGGQALSSAGGRKQSVDCRGIRQGGTTGPFFIAMSVSMTVTEQRVP